MWPKCRIPANVALMSRISSLNAAMIDVKGRLVEEAPRDPTVPVGRASEVGEAQRADPTLYPPCMPDLRLRYREARCQESRCVSSDDE